MTARGIEAAGVYVPEFRLDTTELEDAWGTSHAGGVGTKAVPAADEDAITMAVAASERALDRSAIDPDACSFVGVATTTPPLEEDVLAARIVRMLNLPTDVATCTATGSTVAGAEVLERALSADGPALVAAADCPIGEPADTDHPLGAGAAAFVITDDPAVEVLETAWHVDEYPGIRYRRPGSTAIDSLDITTYQRDAMREAIGAAIDQLGITDVHAAALHQPDAGIPYRITRGLPFGHEVTARGTVVDAIGDAGAAGVPIGLAAALESADAGDRSVAGFFGGGGGAAAVVCDGRLPDGIGDPIDGGTDVTYPEYLRKRGYVVSGEVAGGGAHVSLPSWRQSLPSRYRLVAGRCPSCDGVAFPPAGACPACGRRVEFNRVELPRTGTVRAVTVIGHGGAPPEFASQQERGGSYGVAIVELADGARLPAQLTDADPGRVEIGDRVEATIRRVYDQEGVPRYGVKFTATR